MSSIDREPRRLRVPRLAEAELNQHGPRWKDSPELPLWRQPPSVDALRMEFANRVVRRLVDSSLRMAVISEHGRPAMVDCGELLYELLARDHPIVGVYKAGARAVDVIEDLKAAGL